MGSVKERFQFSLQRDLLLIKVDWNVLANKRTNVFEGRNLSLWIVSIEEEQDMAQDSAEQIQLSGCDA